MTIDLGFVVTELLVILQFMNPVADFFPSYIQIAVFFVWLLLVAAYKPKLFSKCIRISVLSIAIMIITLLRCAIAGKLDTNYFSPMQSVIQRYQFVVYPTLYSYIISLERRKKKKLFDVFIISVLVTLVFSLYYILKVDPQAIRNTQGVSYFGVGDFQFVYALAILCGPFWMFIQKRREKAENYFLYMICFILSIICIILCNLVTSVVIMALSVAITYYTYSKKSYLKIALIILTGVVVSLRNQWAILLRNVAARNIFYWSTNNKLIAIANLISGSGGNLDTLASRARLSKISIESFKSHPLFGINFANHESGVVGCHAQWADDLARFGIVGNLIIWINYIYIAKYVLDNCNCDKIRNNLISSFVLFIILGFLNPALSGTILMCIFVIIPSMEFNYIDDARV